MEERRGLAHRRKHRVGAAGVSRPHLVPSEFERASEDVSGAVAARQNLGAEADSENRLVRIAEGASERRLALQIRMVLVVERILCAAQHDEGVEAVGRRRKRFVRMGSHDLTDDAGSFKLGADKPERGFWVVLNDEDAHVSPSRRSGKRPLYSVEAASFFGAISL